MKHKESNKFMIGSQQPTDITKLKIYPWAKIQKMYLLRSNRKHYHRNIEVLIQEKVDLGIPKCKQENTKQQNYNQNQYKF